MSLSLDKKWIRKSPLSSELKIACEIYRLSIINKRSPTLKELEEIFNKLFSDEITLERYLNNLLDWDFILLSVINKDTEICINSYNLNLIRELYFKYWRI